MQWQRPSDYGASARRRACICEARNVCPGGFCDAKYWKPWKAPGITSNCVGTPASTSLEAYSTSSRTKRSTAPTPIHAGARPRRSPMRGREQRRVRPPALGRDPTGRHSSRSGWRRHPRPACRYGGLARFVRAIIEHFGAERHWNASGISPRSRALIATMAARPPTALSPMTAWRARSMPSVSPLP